MRNKATVLIFATHLVLLLLASTNLSIISWAWGDHRWTWNYFQYTYHDGWGYQYVSNFSLLQVLLYLAAYASGLAVLARLKPHRPLLDALATVVCLLGAASFGLELTHWAWEHHLSWIVSSPGALLVLWVCIGIQVARAKQGGEI